MILRHVHGAHVPTAHCCRDRCDRTDRRFDIAPVVRRSICTYDEKVLSLPLDADYMVTVVRQDLHPAAAIADNVAASLASWEDFATFAESVHGQDMNGDGIADFGERGPPP